MHGQLTDATTTVIKELLRSAGAPSVAVSSLQRTPEDQARIMFDNIMADGVAKQKELYGPNGDAVIDVWVQETTGLKRSEIRAQRTTIETAMVDKINELGPFNVSHHIADPNSGIQTVDLAPSSIAASARAKFQSFAQSDSRVAEFFGPRKGDKAFHVEIIQ